MRKYWFLLAGLLSLCSAAAYPTYDFSLNGPGAPSSDFFFSLPATLTPDFVVADGSYFVVDNVSYMQGGFSPCPCTGSFTFYTTSLGENGGVATPDGYFAGPQLFSGLAAMPSFDLGLYDITYINPNNFYNSLPGSVLITQAGPVPEPASWLLLFGGLGIAGWRGKRRAQLKAG